MTLHLMLLALWLTVLSTVSAIGLHAAHEGLLQMSPSFSGDGVNLYPGLHPDHDLDDLNHLVPALDRQLYYSQEGHRPALHGAKHAEFKATFQHPTVVLEHSRHVKSVQCYPHDDAMEICMKNRRAYSTIERAWDRVAHSPDGKFNLVTYHVGCGDEGSGKRSFWQVYERLFDPDTFCVTATTVPIQESDALDSGEISWGTYSSPAYHKRQPTKGHVRLVHDDGSQSPGNGSRLGTMDIETDPWALKRFFNDSSLDTRDMDRPMNTSFAPVDEDGLIESRSSRGRDLARRGFEELFEGIWKGIVSLVNGGKVIGFFQTAADIIAGIAHVMLELALITAKLIMVPFGVPFDHAYHHDFKIHKYLEVDKNDRPLATLDVPDGMKIGGVGGKFSVQCAKCGVHMDFSVDGRLAFSISQGITQGRLELRNRDTMRLDAVFGITLDDFEAEHEIPKLRKQLLSVPLSPLAIPGIFILGPLASISAGVEVEVKGNMQLLIGGSFTLSPGTAVIDLIKKDDNKLEGLAPKFTPVLRAQGKASLAVALGLPFGVELGVDVLNGKFKKTVGLIDTPAIFAKAEVSVNEDDSECSNGVALSVGVKNEITIEAFDAWSYLLAGGEPIWEKTLACVKFKGSVGKITKDPGVFNAVNGTLNATGVGSSQGLQDVSAKLTSEAPKNQAFRLVVEAGEKSILVSGKDSRLYLAPREAKYDLTAAWGTTDKERNVLTTDVLGRVVAYQDHMFNINRWYVTALGVYKGSAVPRTYRATSLTMIKTKDGRATYAIPIQLINTLASRSKVEFQNMTYYPTACKTKKGLRLFGTKFGIDNKEHGFSHKGRVNDAEVTQIFNHLHKYHQVANPSSNCRTIQLISNPKGSGGKG